MGFKYCPYCGHEYREGGEVYCGGCGRPVERESSVGGLLVERFKHLFSWGFYDDHPLLSTVIPVLCIFVVCFVVAVGMSNMSMSRDENTFIHNEKIIGKYLKGESEMPILVTENGSYHTSSRIYYMYDVNDTLNGSWKELEIRHYGTFLKGEW